MTSIFCHQYRNIFQDMGRVVHAALFLDVVSFSELLVRILACRLLDLRHFSFPKRKVAKKKKATLIK
ncbi:MAG TPA: hypothetical protein DCS08_01515 [Candidatus Moranbacteria bacterium]|nr:hypothetical protein [Candidatus Moranbacteria bacterium]